MQGAIEKDFLNLLSAHCTTEKGVRQYTLFLRAIGAAGAQLPYKQKVTSSNLVSPTIYFRALYNARFLFWALSSAGEHHLHVVLLISQVLSVLNAALVEARYTLSVIPSEVSMRLMLCLASLKNGFFAGT